MDPVSQGVVGALVPQALARRHEHRIAAVAGALAGMAADLDVLIRSPEDPLLTIEYHRHFTHSLAFIPVGGLLVAGILWPLVRRREGASFRRLALWTTGAYGTGGLLDACTSYGTRLLWPFDQVRVAWDLVSVIDPLFTLPLVALSALALRRRRRRPAVLAWIWIALYLGFAGLQHQRAEDAARALARERGHAPERLVVKPSFANVVVWRSLYVAAGRTWIDGLRVGPVLGTVTRYPGESLPRVSPERVLDDLPPDSVLARDVARFDHFSDGWLAWHPDEPRVLGDVRYATLPDEGRPLWGITVDPAAPERHAPWRTFREVDRARVARLWALIRGR